MHVPYSTPNAGLLPELGILPIKDVINIRKLTFLHHILSLPCDDPVLNLYEQQKKLIYESNWANEVSWLCKHYEIKETDFENKKYKMEKWKILLKNKVKEKVFSELCLEAQSKTKLKNLKYEFLERQQYVTKLLPKTARLVFKIRTSMIDVKTNFKSKYVDDITCRLCGLEDKKNIQSSLQV